MACEDDLESELECQLNLVRQDKHDAILKQDFQRAAELRQRETSLSNELRQIARVRNAAGRKAAKSPIELMELLADCQERLIVLEERVQRLENERTKDE